MRALVTHGKVGVNEGCRLFEISKSSYYEASDPQERLEVKYADLKDKVRAIIKGHSEYGIRRIKAALKLDYGIIIDKQVLGKLLKLWGLQLKRKIKKTEVSWIVKLLHFLGGRANLVKRIMVTKALQVITSDITYIDYGGGRAYLCVHKDSYAQVVYGWSLGITMEVCLVMESFHQAGEQIRKIFGIKQLPKTTIWHQDRGSQNTSYEYVGAVLEVGRISYSDPGTPTDNAGQESFFGRLKDEHRDEIAECRTLEELRRLLDKLITQYNTERIHTSIGYQRPMTFLKSLLIF